MQPYTIALVLIAILSVTCLITWLSFTCISSRRQARRFADKYNEDIRKDPVDIDLAFATTTQLLEEMRKRPSPEYILLLPKFEPLGINLHIEVHNLPPHVSLGLLEMAYKLAKRQNRQVTQQSEELFPDEDE